MNDDEMRGRLGVINFIRQRLSKSEASIIDKALIVKWLNKAEAYDGVRRRYPVSSKIKRLLS